MLIFSVSGDPAGAQNVVIGLRRFKDMTNDLTPYWPLAIKAARDVIDHTFAYEGSDSQFGVWKRLSPNYARWKFRKVGYNKILVLTGRLKASLLGGPEGRVAITPLSATVTSDVPYGGYHEEGAGFNPRRPPWSPTQQDAFKIVDVIGKRIRADANRLFASKSSFVGRFQQAMS